MSAGLAAVPTAVGPAAVCRIKLPGGITYSTRRVEVAEAVKIFDEVAEVVRLVEIADRRGDQLGEGPLIDFPAVHHEHVRVRADRITAIEVVRVDTFAGSPS